MFHKHPQLFGKFYQGGLIDDKLPERVVRTTNTRLFDCRSIIPVLALVLGDVYSVETDEILEVS